MATCESHKVLEKREKRKIFCSYSSSPQEKSPEVCCSRVQGMVALNKEVVSVI